MKKNLVERLLSFSLIVALISLSGCSKNNTYENDNLQVKLNETLHEDGYKLQQVLVLSRHNIRSPLSEKGSLLNTMTPHEWFNWTSNPSQLSIRGGVLETEFGQFFRKWTEKEGLFKENYDPQNVNIETDEVRIYANSKQRTLATANYFLTGLFPVSDIDVEHHMNFDEMDPVFNPVLTNISDKEDEFINAATNQIEELFSDKINNLKSNYDLIEKVIDVKDSDDYKSGKFTGFKVDDSVFAFNENKEPSVTGSLKTACQISDALTLQYYEGEENVAAFGKKLTFKEWEDIAEVKDVYEDVLFTAPIVATNVAKPLLKEMLSELKNDNRKFTFLCGHDSNVASVLASLSVKDYLLPNAIEKKTPIGCKIVISKWVKDDSSNEEYISVNMVYQTIEQLRGIKMLDEKSPPAIFTLSFDGLEKNEDNLYRKDDIIKRFEEAIAES